VNGVATFAELRLDKAGSGYTLTAAAPELRPDTSAAFSVMPAPATQLLFTVHPSAAMQDSAITPPVEVTAYDSLGNEATNFAGSVRLRIGTDGSVSKNAGLTGAVTPAVAGVATFPDVRIDQTGIGYTLTAAFGSAAPVDTSVAFAITLGPPPPPPPPTHLGFTQQPQTTNAGATITPPVQVAALDAAEHVVQGFTGAITLALGANPGGGTLSGGAPVNAVNGVATFPSVSIDKPGNAYTMRATASGLTDAASTAFNITAPPPATGDLTVTTATSGSNPPSGYTVTVDGGQSRSLGLSASTTYTGLTAASHTVQLSGVPANCSVSEANPQTVTVPAGATAQTSFTITCTAPNQAPSVTAGSDQTVLVGAVFTLQGASFSDPDHDGPWTVTIDWGDGTSPTTFTTSSEGSISRSHSYGALLLTTYTLTVTVTDAHGASGSASKTVTVVLL
jgi:hypothetical protein